MLRFKVVLACLAGTFIYSSGNLFAQAPPVDPVTFSFDGGGVHQDSTDLKDGGGSFDVDRWFLSAGVTYAWDRRTSMGLTIGGGRSSYSFDENTGFGSGDPWSKVEDFRISAPVRFKVGEKGVAFLIPTVRFNKENGADTGDSATYGLFAAVAWRIDEDLTIGPGIGVFSRLEDSARIFPVLAIDWNITDHWNLSTGSGLGSSVGPGLSLSYKFNDHWKLALGGRYESEEFRLDDKGPAAGGVGRDQSFPLVISGILEPNAKTRFSLFAGVELGGELKLKDAFGITIDETKYDPALIIGATFAVGF